MENITVKWTNNKIYQYKNKYKINSKIYIQKS